MSGVSQAVRVANDRSVLLGLLAWQLGLATREHVEASLDVWQQDRTQAFDALLKQRARLSPEQSAWLANVAAAVIRQHGNDAAASLDALGQLLHVRSELSRRIDPEVTLDRGLVASSAAPISRPSSTIAAAASTSRFENLKRHARGGMGEVFIAEDREFARKVALKKIRPEHAGDLLMHQHFQRESQLTGNLEHPGIVPVYSAGRHSDGQPYFAMRLIRGVSLETKINEFHQAQKHFTSSEFRQLLTQFITVCNTVAYAHSKQILHRDLKPANIMVGDYGETLVVDWGLARGWEQDSAPASEFGHGLRAAAHQTTETESGGIVGTLPYMSPEQAGNRVFSFQPAADIFSLGATFYYLLTGQAPHPPARSDKEREQTLQDIQAGKFPPPRSVRSAIPKPLEAICLKAMALHPDHRYSSALDLAADLELYLADEPVTAYREPIVDRTRRWMKRHRTLVSAVGVALLLLVAGSVGYAAVVSGHNQELAGKNTELTKAKQSLEQANGELQEAKQTLEGKNTELVAANAAATAAKEEAERKQAEAENARQETEEILTALQGCFRRADPAFDGESVTVLHVMKLLEDDITLLFPDRPRIQAKMLNTIGQINRSIGRYPDSARQHQRAYDLTLLQFGEADETALESMINLAHTIRLQDRVGEAIDLYQNALKGLQSLPEPPEERIITVTSSLGLAYLADGQTREAIAALEKSRRLMSEKFGEDDPETWRIVGRLASAYQEVGRLDEAIAMLEQVLRARQKKLGKEHVDTLLSMNDLAVAYNEAERFAEGAELLEEALTMTIDRFGKEHPRVMAIMHNLGSNYMNSGRTAEAVELLEKSLDIMIRRVGANHPETQNSKSTLAKAYLIGGMPEKGLPLMDEFVQFKRNRFGADSLHYAAILRDVSVGLIEQKQLAAAERYLKIAEPIFSKNFPGHINAATVNFMLGRCLLEQRKFAEAEPLFLAAQEVMVREGSKAPDGRRIVIVAFEQLIELYKGWDKPIEEQRWKEKLAEWKAGREPN